MPETRASTKLRKIVDARKGSRTEAAREIGISQPYLSQLLSGVRAPSYATMRRIREWSGGKVAYEDWETAPGNDR